MKNILLGICLSFFVSYSANSQKIHIEKDENLAYKLAKSEDKLLCYFVFNTTLRASKNMMESTLKDPEFTEFQNQKFVNVWISETNKDFKELVYDYRIYDYPTFIYADYEGKLVHKTTGFMPPEELIRNGLLAIEGPKNVSKHFKKEYKKHKRNPAFLMEYVNFNLDIGKFDKANSLLKEYLKHEEKIDSSEWMDVCLNYALDHRNPCFKKVDKYRSDFIEKYGEQRVNATLLNGAMSRTYENFNPYWEFEDFERNLLKNVDRLDMKNYDVLLTNALTTTLFSGDFVVKKQDKIDYSVAYLKCCLEKKNLDLAYESARYVVVNSKIEAQIQLVESAMKEAFEMNEDIKAMDILSLAQYKLSKTEEANQSVAEAKRLAELYQVPYTSTLSKIGVVAPKD